MRSINWAHVLGPGDRSGELEIQKYETSPYSETGLEYWRNYYKKLKLDLVSLLVSPALSSTSSKPSSVLFS
jgi:hypothetical protein